MKIIFHDECWVCHSEYEYIHNEDYEERGWYYFKCKKCDEIILVPKENPALEILEE